MKGGRTKMRAEFWKVSVTRDRCFIDTPPRVPEAALTTIVGSALVGFAGRSGNR